MLHATASEMLATEAETIILVIEKTAHTGLRGDGKIYVSTIDQAVSIQTGERGTHIV